MFAVAETYTAHFEEFDAIVEILTTGEARLIFRSPGGPDEIHLDGSALATVNAMWERATRPAD